MTLTTYRALASPCVDTIAEALNQTSRSGVNRCGQVLEPFHTVSADGRFGNNPNTISHLERTLIDFVLSLEPGFVFWSSYSTP
jgi:hypothetical protein